MPSGVSAGHETTLMYLWEDNGFSSSPTDSTHKTFGADPTLDTAEGSNALQRVFRPGKRAGIDQIAMIFEGSWAVSFTLTNPWWVASLIGEPSQTDNADGTYTYTYSMTQDGSPTTMRIINGHEQSGKERVLKGCMATRCTIDVNVEGEVEVTLEGAYADEEILTPASLTSQPTKNYDPLTFAEGSISVGGTVENYVQSMSLTVENNIDPIREMGTRVVIDYNPKTIEPSVDFGKLFEGDHTSLEALFGGSGATTPQEDADDNQASVDMGFDNAKAAGSGQNTGTFTLSGTLTESYGESGTGDPTADLEENINRSGLEPSLSWTNEESAAP
jgi:hypothetical protein